MGGNVFENTKRATSKDVAYVVELIKQGKILPKGCNFDVIGSASSYETSKTNYGDIDICVTNGSLAKSLDSTNYWKDMYMTWLFNNNITYKNFSGLGIITLHVPVERKLAKQKYVQVDIITVDCMDYAKWSYRQPQNSKFTSAVRNDALMTVAKYRYYEVIKYINDVPAEWYRGLLDLRLGLYSCRQNVIGKNNNIIKKKTITNKYHNSVNPCYIVRELFGDSFDLHVTDSYETIIEAINSDKFKNKKHRDTILQEIETNIMKRGEKRYAQ